MAKTAAALHILVKEEQLALDLLEQIKNGADFGKLAKKHSICPSGKRGGDLGEFRQGQMVPAFDKVVFSCPELEPTGPLHTQFGYHIIKDYHRPAVEKSRIKLNDVYLTDFFLCLTVFVNG